jgi:protein phosphatase
VPEGADQEVVGANVILQALGSSSHLDVVVTFTPLAPGDTILLCSDGLSGVVPHAVIGDVLRAHDDPDRACDALIAHTLDAGAPDNVTCVVFQLRGWS